MRAWATARSTASAPTGDYTLFSLMGGATRLDLHARLSKIGVGAPLTGLGSLCPIARSDLYSKNLNYFSGATLSRPAIFSGVVPSFSLYSERRSEFDAFLRTTPVGGNVTLSRPLGRVTEAFSYSVEYGRTEAQPALLCAVFNACQPGDMASVQRLQRLAVASLSVTNDGSNNPVNPTHGTVLRLEFRTAGAYTGRIRRCISTRCSPTARSTCPRAATSCSPRACDSARCSGRASGSRTRRCSFRRRSGCSPAARRPCADSSRTSSGRPSTSRRVRHGARPGGHAVLPGEGQRREPAHDSDRRQRARRRHARSAHSQPDPSRHPPVGALPRRRCGVERRYGRREHRLQLAALDAGIRRALPHSDRHAARGPRVQPVPAAGRRRVLRHAGRGRRRAILREPGEHAAGDGEGRRRVTGRRHVPGIVPAAAAELPGTGASRSSSPSARRSSTWAADASWCC